MHPAVIVPTYNESDNLAALIAGLDSAIEVAGAHREAKNSSQSVLFEVAPDVSLTQHAVVTRLLVVSGKSIHPVTAVPGGFSKPLLDGERPGAQLLGDDLGGLNHELLGDGDRLELVEVVPAAARRAVVLLEPVGGKWQELLDHGLLLHGVDETCIADEDLIDFARQVGIQ